MDAASLIGQFGLLLKNLCGVFLSLLAYFFLVHFD